MPSTILRFLFKNSEEIKMKKVVFFILFLLVFGTISARSKFNETTIKGELRKPGVKLVAIDFYMTGCEPCDAAIPVWKKMKKEYGDALKLIVVAPQRDNGTCNVKGWNNVKMICDEDMEIAGEWGVKDFPQAFLYSWHNNDPLVKLGHVNDVEKAIKEYFKHIPRVAIDADKSTKNMVSIIEEELIRNSKIELVSDESDRQSLLSAKKKSHQLNYDEGLKCELGKEIAANSILKVTKQDEDLVLKLSSVEKICTMAAATKNLSGDRKKLKTEIASAVYDLLSQMFGNISMPESGSKSVATQSFSSSNNGSSRDAKACKYAEEEDSLEAWQDYLNSFSGGECEMKAKGRIRKLKKDREEQEKRAEYLKGRKIGNLIWSDLSVNEMTWDDAKEYCENLTEGGYTDWRLPNINELRTLIKNCKGSRTGGYCAVQDPHCLSDDACLSNDCFCECRDNTGYYSKLGDDGLLWSSSTTRSDKRAWFVHFGCGGVTHKSKGHFGYQVRCVR